ncbi:MAG: ABC transporter permease [Myxococcota bacterium]|nr:ABC transporter permease [Deltaproteobacteria bacterium]MDQ3335078.1 ABC transporter permease [Myxococcota bacterium]
MIGAAIRKDAQLLLRDRGALISLFVLPVVFMLAFGSMFRFGPSAGKPQEIAIWHAPGDARGELIASSVDQAEGFTARRVTTADAVRKLVADEDVKAGLVVPAAPEQVELVIDLGAPLQARGPLQGALTGIVMRAMAPVPLDAMPQMVEARSPPGITKPLAGISSFQVTVPGNAVLFGFFISLTTALAFGGERKTGTWRRLLAAPVPRWKALLSTLVPYFLVGVCQLAFLFGVGAGLFGMQIAGSIAALVVLSLSVVYCAVSLGLLFAAIGGSEKQLGGVGSVVLLVMGMLGGCMVPRLVMPAFMKSLGMAVPHSWALEGYYAVLVREGTSLADVAPNVGMLLGFGTGFALLGLVLFRFER